jgi:hypothetical protein
VQTRLQSGNSGVGQTHARILWKLASYAPRRLREPLNSDDEGVSIASRIRESISRARFGDALQIVFPVFPAPCLDPSKSIGCAPNLQAFIVTAHGSHQNPEPTGHNEFGRLANHNLIMRGANKTWQCTGFSDENRENALHR